MFVCEKTTTSSLASLSNLEPPFHNECESGLSHNGGLCCRKYVDHAQFDDNLLVKPVYVKV